jgi:hypothetical protein
VSSFQPVSRPLNRLVRLSVVLDPRNPLDRQRQIGRMCELAGIDAVWGTPPLDALAAIAGVTRDLRLGLAVDVVEHSLHGRAVDAPSGPSIDALGHAERVIQTFLYEVASCSTVERFELTLPGVGIPPTVLARWRSRARLGLRVVDSLPAMYALVADCADDAVLSSATISGAAGMATALELLRAACEAAARDPATLGVALEVPVSVGRTTAEAFARAAAEPLFDQPQIGQPAVVGIFGTLEECQARVAQLAYAGVTDLRCSLPNAPDLPDVIAQLAAMTVGHFDTLTPNAPRSKPPDPPATWGGRSRFPRSP